MEEIGPLLSGTPCKSISGFQGASGEGVHNGHPWRVQDHLLRALQSVPVTLGIVMTFRMIIILIMIIVNIYILCTKTQVLF